MAKKPGPSAQMGAPEQGEQPADLAATREATLLTWEHLAGEHRRARHGVAELGLKAAPLFGDGLHRLEGSDWLFRIASGVVLTAIHVRDGAWALTPAAASVLHLRCRRPAGD